MAIANFKPLLDRLLDRPYAAITAATLAAIAAGIERGRMASRLDQLDEEAERLEAADERFSIDDVFLAAVVAELATVALRNRALVDGIAVQLQDAGVDAAITAARAMSLPGISDAALARVGVNWLRPDPNAIAALINYAQSDAWDASLARYGAGVPQIVRDIAIRGITSGRGPVAVARDVRAAATNLPRHYAEDLMRSLQLNSYRKAVALSYTANASIISHQVRIAALDGRQCVTCTALHGTRMEVGEVVSDHRNGRCTSIGVVRGLERLAEVETGEDWFARQPEAIQRGVRGIGEAGYEAIISGRATLRDFVDTANDPVFGEVVRVKSLTELGLRP